ncbi:MAG TPA: tetratricopeptide repeat protein, partial [Tenuifilaceae bacterium]|nr:tetratricopeptide repeat protein [Tenuifilaceae bacterium]
MRKLISAILAILPMFTTFGQRSDIDSLLKQLNEAPNTSVKAETAIDLAQRYINIDTDSAMAFNQIAHQLATDLSDTALMIRCENTYGFIFNVNSSFEKARERFSRVLEMAISAHDSSLIASAYGNIGNTYMFEQKYSMAVESFLKALDIFEKRNNQKGVATVYGVLGNLYLSLDKLDQSLEYYQKAQSMFHTLGWAD